MFYNRADVLELTLRKAFSVVQSGVVQIKHLSLIKRFVVSPAPC